MKLTSKARYVSTSVSFKEKQVQGKLPFKCPKCQLTKCFFLMKKSPSAFGKSRLQKTQYGWLHTYMKPQKIMSLQKAVLYQSSSHKNNFSKNNFILFHKVIWQENQITTSLLDETDLFHTFFSRSPIRRRRRLSSWKGRIWDHHHFSESPLLIVLADSYTTLSCIVLFSKDTYLGRTGWLA